MTCCDTDQLITFKTNMGLPQQFFHRCPSCYHNFLNLYCYQTCHKSNSNWVSVNKNDTETFITPNNKTKIQIKKVGYLITHEFANGMFNSCKQVQMPSGNEKALSIFCGHPAADCTIQKWLDYMGDTSNGHTPFKINFTITTDEPWIDPTTNITYTPMNVATTNCNETALNRSACSCQDCKASCGEIPSYPKPTKPPTILGFDSWYFIMFILYIIFLLFFGTYVLCYNIIFLNAFGVKEESNRYDSTTEDRSDLRSGINGQGRRVKRNLTNHAAPLVSKNSINCFEKIGAKIEIFLQTVFTKWGTCCARHPIIVIVLGIIVAGGLSAGISVFKVTTNPVELWSAKNSRARMEKDYFDSHFG